MTWIYSLGLLLGRILIASIFLIAGTQKILNYNGYLQMMTSKGIPFASVLLLGAIVFLLLGSISVILGYKTRIGALLLILFLIPTTLIFHNFWGLPAEEASLQQIMFMKNLSILGGLILLVSAGPGGCSFDACLGRFLRRS
ncbi:DoxX family protein [Criblamydia sequanensis]|uniref:Membrane protein n=1 Tax=Candidatus Criblamydia sequanensis CRIB-18 TaxID=1437425 RepID=A0A090CXU4_9BACT|nr:DoxX family protein [Criblamydia sequanensis]CDR33042.1 putative membrane protein [Criblamydia sequanensis CRIB-18]